MSGDANRERARALRNVLTNWGGVVLNALIAFVLSPYIVRTLGDDAYGSWVLVSSLVGYLGLLDAGVRGAMTRYIATGHAAGRHEDASRLASAALAFFSAAGALALVASAAVGHVLMPYFEVPEALRAIVALVLVLSGANVAVALVSGVYGGIVVGVQRFDRLNAIGIASALVRAAAIYGALELGTGLVGLACVQLAISLAQGLATFAASRTLYPELRVRLGGFRTEHLRTLITFGLASTLINASSAVIDYSNSVIIAGKLAVGAITPFAIAATLCLYTREVINGISYVVAPMAGALEGRGQLERAGGLLISGARFATLATAPIAVVLALRGPAFIGLWMGPEYREPAGAVLLALLPAVLAFASFQVLQSAMIGLNRHRGLVPIFLLETLANIALSLWWVGPLGIVGVALGTTIPRLVNCLVVGPLYAARHAGVSMFAYWREGLLRPCLAMGPFALVTYGVEARWPAASLMVYFAQVAATLPVAAAGGWVIALQASERREARATVWSALGFH